MEKTEAIISSMFNQISSTYDLLNRILSFGIDKQWRQKVVAALPPLENLKVLDVATGTCDQLMAMMEMSPNTAHAIGVDIAEEMIKLGNKKLQNKHYANRVQLQIASATQLPFEEETFDCATISFGIRNMDQMDVCLKEIHRVLKTGGKLLILEFSIPQNPLVRLISLFYLRFFLPKLGGLISKHKKAYSYLNQSIESFPCGEEFCHLLSQAKFVNTKSVPLTFGVASLYHGEKK